MAAGPRAARPGRLRSLIFAALAVALMLGAAEIALRLSVPATTLAECLGGFNNPHRDQPSSFVRDDRLFWRLKAPNPGWQVNAQGMRNAPVERAKPAGTWRAICLGDSCTFGLGPEGGVARDRTYPLLLQGLLAQRRPDLRIEVLNAAVPGYSSLQGLRYLESELFEYRPDLVLIYFGINDSYEARCFADKDQRVLDALPAGAAGLQSALRRSRLYLALGWLVRRGRGGPGPLRPGAEYLERVEPDDFRANLERMRELGRRHGFEVLPIQALYLDEHGAVHSLAEWSTPGALNWEQAARDLAAHGQAALYPAPDNVHPTAAGHALLAGLLAERIAPDPAER